MATSDRIELEDALGRDLLSRFGPMLGNEDLWRVLGFATQDAFRQAVKQKRITVPVFNIPGRRGKFALARDVATWLAGIPGSSEPGRQP